MYTVEFYQTDLSTKWKWKIISGNKTIAISANAYQYRSGAVRSFKNLEKQICLATAVDIKG